MPPNTVTPTEIFDAGRTLYYYNCNGAPSLMGVPVTYINGGWNIKHDTVLAGIYCVTGDVKIQARVSGTGTIISTGVINKVRTAGGDQNLTTADPTARRSLTTALVMA